jgi:hypothetical protein
VFRLGNPAHCILKATLTHDASDKAQHRPHHSADGVAVFKRDDEVSGERYSCTRWYSRIAAD